MALGPAIALAAIAASAIQQNWEAVLPVLYWSGFVLAVVGALFAAWFIFDVFLGVAELLFWVWPLAALFASIGWFWATGFGAALLAIFFWVAVAGSVALVLLGLLLLEEAGRARVPPDAWLSVPSLVLFAWFPGTGWFFGIPPLLSVLYRLFRHLSHHGFNAPFPAEGFWTHVGDSGGRCDCGMCSARRSSRGQRTAPPPPPPPYDYVWVGSEGRESRGGAEDGPPRYGRQGSGYGGPREPSPPPPRSPTRATGGPDREPRDKAEAIEMARGWVANGERGRAAKILLKAGYTAQEIAAMMEVLAREEPPGGYA
ncbi:MAG: hypothetical protein QXO51_04185 [Halobacteria archaeon]